MVWTLLGGGTGSIVLRQPTAIGAFTQDDVEGLAAECFNRIAVLPLAEFDFEKPTTATSNAVDPDVHRFHASLVKMLRWDKSAFHMDLRQRSGTGTEQVWNQGCFKYETEMKESPAADGDIDTEKILQIRLKTTFTCNDDFLTSVAPHVSVGNPASTLPKRRREQETEYDLLYADNSGLIDANGSHGTFKQNWRTMYLIHDAKTGAFAAPGRPVFVPGAMMDARVRALGPLLDLRGYPSRNPNVTAANLMGPRIGLVLNHGF